MSRSPSVPAHAATPAARSWRRRLRRAGWACLALALLLLALRLWPQPPLREAAPLSRVVLAEDGALLRLTLARDGQYRLWVPLERVAPSLVEAMLLKEDRHFFRHPGVNPAALLRAARETWGGGMRQGGSTLSMQLARRLQTGGVFVNGFSASDPRVPIGGIKKSGYGRELSDYGVHEFMNIQTVWFDRK